jgi:hypothetical protein
VHLRTVLALLLATSPVAADPVATVAQTPARTDSAAAAADPSAPVAEAEPTVEQLAAAPAPDQASGIAVKPAAESHPIANTLLALPRLTAQILLRGPRFAAAEVDEYLENQSPNAYGRGVERYWRFGATFEWEDGLGPGLGLRVGRRITRTSAIDTYVGVLNMHGQSAGVRATLGRYTAAELEPMLAIDAGRDLDRVFAGIDMRGPVAVYDEQRIATSLSLGARAGWFRMRAGTGVEAVRAGNGDDTFVATYDPMLAGYGETQRAATGELGVAYDSRRPSYRWIRRSAPSTGFLLGATAAYTLGTADRSGAFRFGGGMLEARRLFDLFHGDRVLTVGARAEAITDDDVPFDRLPSLGGRDMMRAFARTELRAQRLGFGEIQYEWPLGGDSRAFVFVEGGGSENHLHADYGGGLRFLSGASTAARLQLAASDTGELGFFLQLGAL